MLNDDQVAKVLEQYQKDLFHMTSMSIDYYRAIGIKELLEDKERDQLFAGFVNSHKAMQKLFYNYLSPDDSDKTINYQMYLSAAFFVSECIYITNTIKIYCNKLPKEADNTLFECFKNILVVSSIFDLDLLTIYDRYLTYRYKSHADLQDDNWIKVEDLFNTKQQTNTKH